MKNLSSSYVRGVIDIKFSQRTMSANGLVFELAIHEGDIFDSCTTVCCYVNHLCTVAHLTAIFNV